MLRKVRKTTFVFLVCKLWCLVTKNKWQRTYLDFLERFPLYLAIEFPRWQFGMPRSPSLEKTQPKGRVEGIGSGGWGRDEIKVTPTCTFSSLFMRISRVQPMLRITAVSSRIVFSLNGNYQGCFVSIDYDLSLKNYLTIWTDIISGTWGVELALNGGVLVFFLFD